MWRGSVVRMKSSKRASNAGASSRHFGASESTYCCGVIPAAAAALATFWPCSSVPVRARAGPCARAVRTSASAAIVV